jgi:anaerobic selenocysteine-containing dehydrogenase
MDSSKTQRRQFLKIGGAALIALPALAIAGNAAAATNGAMRTSLKYQAKPEADKQCSNCLQFVAPGGCKLMPGDTEISPNGYCVAWVKK